MGWFFNRRNNVNSPSVDEAQSDNQNASYSTPKTSKSFYSKKRKCQTDPDDSQYMICKTVIKDNNGTREEEQRIPSSSNSKSSFQESSSFSTSSYFNFPFGNIQREQQTTFDKFPSFFIQPSFFDFHNSTPNPSTSLNGPNQYQNHSFTKSFIKENICRQDPEDSQYLICKSKIRDGDQVKQTQERVKISDQHIIPNIANQLNGLGEEFDRQMQNIVKDLNFGFGLAGSLLGPFARFLGQISPQNIEKHMRTAQQQSNHSSEVPKQGFKRDHQQSNPNIFFSSNQRKDTSMYDL